MIVSITDLEIVDVNRRTVDEFLPSEYSTGIPPASAVDAIAVEAKQVPAQRKLDRVL